MQVLVRDNNVDQALKALKKKMQREGIFREMKLRRHYEKPRSAAPAKPRKLCAAPASSSASGWSARVSKTRQTTYARDRPRQGK